jgi:hypothetical protein
MLAVGTMALRRGAASSAPTGRICLITEAILRVATEPYGNFCIFNVAQLVLHRSNSLLLQK